MKTLALIFILIISYSSMHTVAGPLHRAVFANNLDNIKQFIAKGENVNEINEAGSWPLLIATTYGYSESVKLLINKGANVNLTNQHGYTALHEAANLGYIKIVKLLVNNNADINKADINNYNALKYSLTSGSPLVSRYLKRHGAVE